MRRSILCPRYPRADGDLGEKFGPGDLVKKLPWGGGEAIFMLNYLIKPFFREHMPFHEKSVQGVGDLGKILASG